MSRKKSKRIGIDFADLPSNYVLKIEDDFIANEKKDVDMLPDEFYEESNLIDEVDLNKNIKN